MHSKNVYDNKDYSSRLQVFSGRRFVHGVFILGRGRGPAGLEVQQGLTFAVDDLHVRRVKQQTVIFVFF